MGAKGTIESYDRIAADYLQRWQDRSIVRQAMERFVALLPSGGLVVDVGCGPGFDTATLRTHGLRAVGMDLSLGMLATGRSRFGVPLIQADMRHLPLPALVDGLWVNASLLHLARHDVLPAGTRPDTSPMRHGSLPTGRGRHLTVCCTRRPLFCSQAGRILVEIAVG